MGGIVNIYKGPSYARTLEGKAELLEVEYKGGGLYRVKCVFVDDPKKHVHTREYDIDEQNRLEGRTSFIS